VNISEFWFFISFNIIADTTRKIPARTLMKVVSTMDLKGETRISNYDKLWENNCFFTFIFL